MNVDLLKVYKFKPGLPIYHNHNVVGRWKVCKKCDAGFIAHTGNIKWCPSCKEAERAKAKASSNRRYFRLHKKEVLTKEKSRRNERRLKDVTLR